MNQSPIQIDFSRRFQWKFCSVMVLGSLITSGLLAVIFSRSLGDSYFQSLELLAYFREQVGDALILTFFIQVILVALITILINIFVSHKIAGPIFRYEQFLGRLLDGELRYDVRTRGGDQLKPLLSAINGMVGSQREVFLQARNLEEDLRNYIKQGRHEDTSGLLDAVVKLQKSLEEPTG